MCVIEFQPLYYERPWGGRILETVLGRCLPKGQIGESWDLVDRPEAQSVVLQGPFSGVSLRVLMQKESAWLMGPQWPANKPFPLIVKWLDCSKRLSLQVHPPAHLASLYHGEPKTEFWYVAKADKQAGIFIGLHEGVKKHDFETALSSNAIEPLLHRIPTHTGDGCFIPSGRLHAIDAGNLILEIQQNSDTTYRAYDWGRLGLDGQPRKLHVSETLACTDFTDYEPALLTKDPSGTWITCDQFRVSYHFLKPADASLFLPAFQSVRILSVLDGLVEVENSDFLLHKGRTYLIPYAESFRCKARSNAQLLLTDSFAI